MILAVIVECSWMFDWGSIPDWLSFFATAIGVGLAIYAVRMAHGLVERHEKRKSAIDVLRSLTEHVYDYRIHLLEMLYTSGIAAIAADNSNKVEEFVNEEMPKIVGLPNESELHEKLSNALLEAVEKYDRDSAPFKQAVNQAKHMQSVLIADAKTISALFEIDADVIAQSVISYADFIHGFDSYDILKDVKYDEYHAEINSHIDKILNQYNEMFMAMRSKDWR